MNDFDGAGVVKERFCIICGTSVKLGKMLCPTKECLNEYFKRKHHSLRTKEYYEYSYWHRWTIAMICSNEGIANETDTLYQ